MSPRLRKQGMAGLLDALKDVEMTIRSQIILTLAEIGLGAKKGVPHLVELAAAKSVDVRGSAVYALGEIGWADKTVVFALSKALKDDDPDCAKPPRWPWENWKVTKGNERESHFCDPRSQ